MLQKWQIWFLKFHGVFFLCWGGRTIKTAELNQQKKLEQPRSLTAKTWKKPWWLEDFLASYWGPVTFEGRRGGKQTNELPDRTLRAKGLICNSINDFCWLVCRKNVGCVVKTLVHSGQMTVGSFAWLLIKPVRVTVMPPLLAADFSSVASIAKTIFEQHRVLTLERPPIKNFASWLVQIQLMNTRPRKKCCPQKLVCLQTLFLVNTF